MEMISIACQEYWRYICNWWRTYSHVGVLEGHCNFLGGWLNENISQIDFIFPKLWTLATKKGMWFACALDCQLKVLINVNLDPSCNLSQPVGSKSDKNHNCHRCGSHPRDRTATFSQSWRFQFFAHSFLKTLLAPHLAKCDQMQGHSWNIFCF